MLVSSRGAEFACLASKYIHPDKKSQLKSKSGKILGLVFLHSTASKSKRGEGKVSKNGSAGLSYFLTKEYLEAKK